MKYMLEGGERDAGRRLHKNDPETCTGCEDCVKVCLGGVIKIIDGKAKAVNYENCYECASCWFVCTTNSSDGLSRKMKFIAIMRLKLNNINFRIFQR